MQRLSQISGTLLILNKYFQFLLLIKLVQYWIRMSRMEVKWWNNLILKRFDNIDWFNYTIQDNWRDNCWLTIIIFYIFWSILNRFMADKSNLMLPEVIEDQNIQCYSLKWHLYILSNRLQKNNIAFWKSRILISILILLRNFFHLLISIGQMNTSKGLKYFKVTLLSWMYSSNYVTESLKS